MPSPKVPCLECGKLKSKRAKRCKSCHDQLRAERKAAKRVCPDCGSRKRRDSKRCHPCAIKATVLNPTWRNNIAKANRIKAKDPEWRANVAKGQRKARASGKGWGPKWRRNVAEANRKKGSNPVTRRKQSVGLLAAWKRGAFGPERNEKIGRIAAANWAHGVYDGVFKNPSSLEIAIGEIFDANGIEYTQQYRLEGDTHPFDFFVPPDVLIEVDGRYWHSTEKAKRRDEFKTALAAQRGFRLLRIPEEGFRRLRKTGRLGSWVILTVVGLLGCAVESAPR